METFIVDGSHTNFADIIINNSVNNESCLVATYGYGFLQVALVAANFENVVLVADIGHQKLNKKARMIVKTMERDNPNFKFIEKKTHIKLAIIDNKRVIFTSANLANNRKNEIYLVGDFEEFEKIENIIGNIFTENGCE